MTLFEHLFQIAPTAVLVTDATGRIEHVNDAALEKLSVERPALPNHISELFSDPEARLGAEIRLAAASSGWRPTRVEVVLGNLAGLRIPVRLRGICIDGDGKTNHVIWQLRGEEATSGFREHTRLIHDLNNELAKQRDLQERLQQALDNERYLHGELIHRVKNNLALLSSIIRLRRRDMDSDHARGVLEELELRTRSIALVHELLDRNQTIEVVNAGELIRELCDLMRGSLIPEGIALDVEVESLRLHNEDATILCLLINELMTNAVKHAFEPSQVGRIELRFRRNGVEKMELNLRDDGRGFGQKSDTVASKTSQGTRIVQALADQINGELHRKDASGTEWTLVFDPRDEQRRVS